VIVYHRTDAADAILRDGFRDSEGSYGFATLTLRGVFLSDVPLDVNEGATGDQLLAVTVPDDVDLDDFELIQEGAPYREWCVPAALVNERCSSELTDDEPVWRSAGPSWPNEPCTHGWV
jgi:hypothetical protein